MNNEIDTRYRPFVILKLAAVPLSACNDKDDGALNPYINYVMHEAKQSTSASTVAVKK